MKILKVLIVSLGALLFVTPAMSGSHGGDHAVILTSATSWTNQSGSVANLTFSPTSVTNVYDVSGSYVNNAQGFGCQGQHFNLNGQYLATAQVISFVVAWDNGSENCQSVTGWTGYLTYSSGWIMTTDWSLATAGAIQQGSDVFKMN